MGTLPIELQLMIFENVTAFDDLRSSLSPSKSYSELISPRLSEHVSVTTCWANFDRLLSICHSQVAKHVRCLHYNIFSMPLIYEAEWNAGLETLRSNHAEEDFSNKFAMYDEYKYFYDGQLSENESVIWKKALSRLPYLTMLEVSERSCAES
jgi:hypothetical protein